MMLYKAVFELILQTPSANLCKPIYDIINYSTLFVLLYLKIVERKGKSCKNCEYLEKEKSFLDKVKNTFHSFWRAIIWWRNKKFIKNSGHKL